MAGTLDWLGCLCADSRGVRHVSPRLANSEPGSAADHRGDAAYGAIAVASGPICRDGSLDCAAAGRCVTGCTSFPAIFNSWPAVKAAAGALAGIFNPFVRARTPAGECSIFETAPAPIR